MAEGFHDFAAAEVLTAANTDDYLMRQTVMRFASAAARDSALSGVLVEGLVAYLKDVDTVTVYTGSAWVTAFTSGALTSWTPTLKQSIIPVTCTVDYAKYQKVGRMVFGNFHVSATGAGTAGGAVTVTTPLTAANPVNAFSVGAGYLADTSATLTYTGVVALSSTTELAIIPASTANSYLGVEIFTAALASGDRFAGSFCFEATT